MILSQSIVKVGDATFSLCAAFIQAAMNRPLFSRLQRRMIFVNLLLMRSTAGLG